MAMNHFIRMIILRIELDLRDERHLRAMSVIMSRSFVVEDLRISEFRGRKRMVVWEALTLAKRASRGREVLGAFSYLQRRYL